MACLEVVCSFYHSTFPALLSRVSSEKDNNLAREMKPARFCKGLVEYRVGWKTCYWKNPYRKVEASIFHFVLIS